MSFPRHPSGKTWAEEAATSKQLCDRIFKSWSNDMLFANGTLACQYATACQVAKASGNCGGVVVPLAVMDDFSIIVGAMLIQEMGRREEAFNLAAAQ